MLADTRERLDWLRMAQARGRYLGMELEIITAAEAKAIFPLMEDQYFVGALFDPVEGHVDPTGVTNAYAMLRPQRRGRGLPPHDGHRPPASGPTAPGTSSPTGARSTPSTSSTPAVCGLARSGG